MYQIKDEQIDFIWEDLTSRGIRTESLRLNLLDHICILIEENLEEGGDFSAAGFISGTIGKIFLSRLTDFLLLIRFLSFVLVFLPLVLVVLLKGFRSRNDLVIYLSGTLSLVQTDQFTSVQTTAQSGNISHHKG